MFASLLVGLHKNDLIACSYGFPAVQGRYAIVLYTRTRQSIKPERCLQVPQSTQLTSSAPRHDFQDADLYSRRGRNPRGRQWCACAAQLLLLVRD